MHDIRAIRDNPDAFDAALARRGLAALSPAILALDEQRRATIAQAEIGAGRTEPRQQRGRRRQGARR